MWYVYRIQKKDTGHYYIGVRKCLKTYTPETDPYYGSGVIIKRYTRKYGIKAFDKIIVATFDNKEKAYDLESNLVNEDTIKDKLCMNLKQGGHGGWDHISNEVRMKGLRKAWFNIKSGITIRKISKISKEECRARSLKAAETCRKNNITPRGMLGRTQSEFVRKKISLNNSNYVWCVKVSAENRQKRKKFKKENIPNGYIPCKEWYELNHANGLCWISNLLTEKTGLHKKTLPIPDGWVKGRKF